MAEKTSKKQSTTQASAKNNLISEDMLIGDIIKMHPHLVSVMAEYGMQCVGCHIASWETLEQAATSHGIEINRLVDALNLSRVE